MPVRSITPYDGDVYLVPGDPHFDQQDDRAFQVMINAAINRRITGCVLVGDTFESSGISRHGRPGRKFRFGKGTIKSEERAARPWIDAITNLVHANRPDAHLGGLYLLTGNHESWWDAVQDEFPGLVDTPWYELYGDLFDDWHVFEECDSLRFGHLLIAHGHRLRGALSRYSAAAVLANYPGQNTLYGHTHRVDACTTPTHKYGEPVRHGAWTVGHMKSMEAEQRDRFSGPLSEKHQQGFAFVHFFDVQGDIRFNVEQAVIDRMPDGSPYTVLGGEVFTEIL